MKLADLLGPDGCAVINRFKGRRPSEATLTLITPLKIVKTRDMVNIGNARRAGKTEGWKR